MRLLSLTGSGTLLAVEEQQTAYGDKASGCIFGVGGGGGRLAEKELAVNVGPCHRAGGEQRAAVNGIAANRIGLVSRSQEQLLREKRCCAIAQVAIGCEQAAVVGECETALLEGGMETVQLDANASAIV